jgi:hypothetical protein
MLWWIVAPDTISAHDVFSKDLTSISCRAQLPTPQDKKKHVRRTVLLLGSLTHLVCGGERWKNAEFPSKIPADLSTDWVFEVWKPRHLFTETPSGNLRELQETSQITEEKARDVFFMFHSKKKWFFAELIFICLMFLMRFVTYGFAFRFLHVFTFFSCKRTD